MAPATARAHAAGLSRSPGSNGAPREAPSGPTHAADPVDPGRRIESLRHDLRMLKLGLRAASRPSLLELPAVFQTDEELEEHRRTLRELREEDLRERDAPADEPGDETPDPEAVKEFVAWAERRREIAAEARRLRLVSNG